MPTVELVICTLIAALGGLLIAVAFMLPGDQTLLATVGGGAVGAGGVGLVVYLCAEP